MMHEFEKTVEMLQSIDSTLKRMEIILLNIQNREEYRRSTTEDYYRLHGIYPTF